MSKSWVLAWEPFDAIEGLFIAKIDYDANTTTLAKAGVGLHRAKRFSKAQAILTFKLLKDYMYTENIMLINLEDHGYVD